MTSFLVDNLGDVSNLTKLNNAAIQAVVETLEKFGINKMAVKWPNDIYVEDKKIAGILIENVVSEQEIKTAVVGVGINVNQQKFVDIAATSVYNELGKQVNLIEFLYVALQAAIQSSSFKSNKRIYLLICPRVLSPTPTVPLNFDSTRVISK